MDLLHTKMASDWQEFLWVWLMFRLLGSSVHQHFKGYLCVKSMICSQSVINPHNLPITSHHLFLTSLKHIFAIEPPGQCFIYEFGGLIADRTDVYFMMQGKLTS